MNDNLSIALAQLNPTVGDVEGNLALALRAREIAAAQGADAVLFSELFLCGYPPEDLLLSAGFQDSVMSAARRLAEHTAEQGPALLIGLCWREGVHLYNAVALMDEGDIQALRYKVHLPNYGVFDEARLFTPGPLPGPVSLRGVPVGVPVCEDIWHEDVVECLSETGASMLLVANGSPFETGKEDARLSHAVARVVESGLPLVYVNQVGGQDELVFDGDSFVLNADRSLAMRLPCWRDEVVTSQWRRIDNVWRCNAGECIERPESLEDVYRALVLGLRDYVDKNGFAGVLLGLSGGIDSALCAVLAVDALGCERVRCVRLPSRYTSMESMEDAEKVARALNVRLDDINIEDAVGEVAAALGNDFKKDVTAENIQSRLRGVLLMAFSNDTGFLLLTTGNKSELSTGYATLYGDMNGGFNPIKDIYKTQVFALARWRNNYAGNDFHGPAGEVIDERILVKPPSAELRADQKDTDTLPPYEMLDGILRCLVEDDMPVSEIVDQGYEENTTRRIENLLLASEYKRRQSAPGVKISARNFGRDRRYPITNRFRSSDSGGSSR
ncbi:MAG: NAD+ synthase [Hyphomicrobiales bacterium]|nr:NAD+ synthase [Hyphomicrobiales bacterium]